MKVWRCQGLALLVALGTACPLAAAEASQFTPLTFPQGNTENRTGTWLSCNLGEVPADVLPLKSRMWATRESVTDGVALKCVFQSGSTATLSFENVRPLPAGSAGITLYAKASRPLKLRLQQAEADVGKEWKKLDFPWAVLGTTADRPNQGRYLTLSVAGPITERTELFLDRLGTEKPNFDPHPRIDPQTGPDPVISSRDILYGAEHLAKTLARVKAKKPLKIYAFGDSITLGFEMHRGTDQIRGTQGVPFLFHHHLARLWQQHFDFQGITVVHGGHGGPVRKVHYDSFGRFLAQATPDDLVIVNLSLDGVTGWKTALKPILATAKTKTDQILVMSPTAGASMLGCLPEMERTLKEISQEEKVAAADILKLMTYRGAKYCWAGEGDEWHPTYMLHIMMAEMMAPLLTDKNRIWPDPDAADGSK